MEHQEQEQEHDVYGGEIPDEGEMDADVEMSRAEEEESNSKDLQDMKKRLKEIEEEAGALREMQAKVEKEMGAVQVSCRKLEILEDERKSATGFENTLDSSSGSATQAEKEEVDSRSIYVGNVDYACTPEEVQQHFQSCGTVNRVTILTDKFGQPKGFAYVEFVEVEAVQNALLLNESELHGRQLKVSAKRTNVPGMKQYRGRRPNPYFGFPSRRPFVPGPPFYPAYGYGHCDHKGSIVFVSTTLKGSKVQAANAVQTILMMVNLALFVAPAEDPMSCSSSGQQSQKLAYYDRISISVTWRNGVFIRTCIIICIPKMQTFILFFP
ncbi:unnamed protein product [Camellia sinensis]